MTDITPRFYESNGKRCIRLTPTEWTEIDRRFDDLMTEALVAGRLGGEEEHSICHQNFVRAHRGGEMATMVPADALLEPLPPEIDPAQVENIQ